MRALSAAARHGRDLARWARHRRRDAELDQDAVGAHLWPAPGAAERGEPGNAPGDAVELRWLGTAGYALTNAGHCLLVDPYATRLPLRHLASRRPRPPDRAAVDRHLPRADAVLIGHTHFDHALDAPAVARRDGCPVYGSRSVATLLGLYGMADRATVVEPYRTYGIGPFDVTFVPSVHSRLALGLWVPNSGPITCDRLDHLSPGAFNCDQVWGIHIRVAGRTIYHQGSADVVDDAVRHTGVDYFLCGIAGRQFSASYVARMTRLLDPQVIVPNHYDDFFRPLDGDQGFTADVGVARFVDEVSAASRDIELRTLRPGRPVAL